MLGDRGDAEEAAQDALVRAYRALATYDPSRIRRATAAAVARDDRPQPLPQRSALAVRLADLAPISIEVDADRPGRTRRDRRDRDAGRGRRAATPSASVGRPVLACPPAGLSGRHRAPPCRWPLAIPRLAEALGRPEGTVKAQVHRGLATAANAARGERSPEPPGDDRMTTPRPTTPSSRQPWPIWPSRAADAAPERPRRGRPGRPLRRDRHRPSARSSSRGTGAACPRRGRDDDARSPRSHAARTGRRGIPRRRLPTGLARARSIDGSRATAGSASTLDLRGHSRFEQDVWRKALEIPRGEVRPYGWIAAEIGRPKAVRAVGTALGHNPVPLIVPCHRVVRSDGMIGQYSLGGPENKRTILAAEGLDPEAMESAARRGERLVGCASTQDRLLADLPYRAAHARAESATVPLARRGGRGRLPSVQGLPPGVGRGLNRPGRIRLARDRDPRRILAPWTSRLCQPSPGSP